MGDGTGNNVAGEKVGNGKGNKGNHHQCHCRSATVAVVHASAAPLSWQLSSLQLPPPQLPNAVALSAAIAAAVAITHLFDIAIKRRWCGQWQWKQ
jgi:hypothetical protein